MVEAVRWDKSEQCVVVSVRPDARRRGRCGLCRRPAALYDRGRGRRRWRDLDHGTRQVFLEADARRGTGHTLAFDQQAAWMAAECSKSAAAELLRCTWRTIGRIVERCTADRDRHTDRLAGLRRTGIDEISYRRGQRYMTVVVDHDTARVVWMADGHGADVLTRFFDQLGQARTARLTHISADGAAWIAQVIAQRAPGALRVMDAFHVVVWATEALNTGRRASWNRARRELGVREQARALKDSRFARWNNAEDLTDCDGAVWRSTAPVASSRTS
ncbi:transposase [Kitasatospora sp. NPDC092286]|uniref:transposase n=1 Tax=Kitasatospora sp. NPDC092286 TaxID=3364087 RepID=UPI003806D32D